MTPNDAQFNWDAKVDTCMGRVYRAANTYLTLGLVLYGGGSALIIYLLRSQPLLVTIVVMYYFQVLVIIFGTRIIFPCIAGAFKVGLLGNRESMPVFERVAEALEDKDSFANRIESRIDKATLDIQAEGGKIREEIRRLSDGFNRPITPLPPVRSPVEVGPENGGFKGAGQA